MANDQTSSHDRCSGFLLLALLLTLGVGQPIAAQTAKKPFADLSRYLREGDTIFVTGQSGETTGKLMHLSPTSLAIVVNGQMREIPSTRIRSIEKRGDSLRNGALIGAVSMVPLPLAGLATIGLGTHPGRDVAIAGMVIVAGAGIGALIDWLHQGRTLVYDSTPHDLTAGASVVAIQPGLRPEKWPFESSLPVRGQ